MTPPLSQKTEMELIKKDLDVIMSDISEIKQNLKSQYAQTHEVVAIASRVEFLERTSVTKEQMWPIQRIVYGAVGLILLGVLGSLLALITIRVP